MLSTSPATIAVSRFDGRCVQTNHYVNLEEMIASLLMNSGDKIPFLVRDTLLPPAIATWEKTLKQDNCEHKWDANRVCTLCELEG